MHIKEISVSDCESLFMQGFDMEVDKHTKIVMFKRGFNTETVIDLDYKPNKEVLR